MITKLLSKLKDKARRELFVAGQIKTGIPFQIRALRDKKGWTQADLGARLGMTQTNISRLESPGYGKLNLTTLQRLAAAFDVALIVRFVPFSHLIRWADDLSPEDMAPESFEEESSKLKAWAAAGDTSKIKTTTTSPFLGESFIVGDTSQALFSFNPIRISPVGVTVISSLNRTPKLRQQDEEAFEEFGGALLPPSTIIDYTSGQPF